MGDMRMAAAPSELRHRILLVDDDVDQRDAIACFLEMEGVDANTAVDGREALYALRNGPRPCLILLDLNMVGMDGREFRRRQLLWPQMAGIPVVVLSGHPELKTATRAMEAVEVWRKPVELHLLLRAVGDHCHGHSRGDSLSATVAVEPHGEAALRSMLTCAVSPLTMSPRSSWRRG
jgi:CheY-like chemotaxis protein